MDLTFISQLKECIINEQQVIEFCNIKYTHTPRIFVGVHENYIFFVLDGQTITTY